MARYAFGMRTLAGSATQAQMSLFGILGVGCTVREVGVSNTTNTRFTVGLARFADTTNVGLPQLGGPYDEKDPAPSMRIFAGHPAAGTVGQVLRQWFIGAAYGASVIWTFGDKGLIIQPGVGPNPSDATGIGPICPGGGQISEDYIEWDE